MSIIRFVAKSHDYLQDIEIETGVSEEIIYKKLFFPNNNLCSTTVTTWINYTFITIFIYHYIYNILAECRMRMSTIHYLVNY